MSVIECLHKLNRIDYDDPKQLEEVFQLHTELNNKLFDTETNQLYSDIRLRLVEIADMFVQSIQDDEIPIKVLDYWLVGSNAAYNYSDTSDIDVHIIVNMDLGLDSYILKLLYDYIKSSFNDKYDIKVKGHEVELYLEDVETSAVTNGIYSLKLDKWIKEPTRETEPRIYDITETDIWNDAYIKYLNLSDTECEEFLDDLYVMRKISLANDGEWGDGNLVFKEFRNRGYIEDLKNRKYKVRSKELTLESVQPLTEYTKEQRNLNQRVKRRFRQLARDAGIDIVTNGLTVHHLDDKFDENNIKPSEWAGLYLINGEQQTAATLHKIIHYKNDKHFATLKDAFDTLLDVPVYQYDEPNDKIIRIKLS